MTIILNIYNIIDSTKGVLTDCHNRKSICYDQKFKKDHLKIKYNKKYHMQSESLFDLDDVSVL